MPHTEYVQLGKTDNARHDAYQQLLKQQLAEITLFEIRNATNKAWALGSVHFIHRIQTQSIRRVQPNA